MRAYSDRYHAGKILAEYLVNYIQREDTVILAIPRGGVPVAYEVAQSLFLPLDVLVVQKLAIPGLRELTLGSIAANDCITFNETLIHKLGIRKSAIDHILHTEHQELLRRESVYHENNPMINLENKTIIIIDDGIGTGSTMRTAIQCLKNKQVKNIVIAAPFAKRSAYESLKPLVHEIICPQLPGYSDRLDLWYQDYFPITEEEAIRLLRRIASNGRS